MKKYIFPLILLLLIGLFAGCTAPAEPETIPDAGTGQTADTGNTGSSSEPFTEESTEFGVPDESLLKKAAAGSVISGNNGAATVSDGPSVTIEIVKDLDPTARSAVLLCDVSGQTWDGTVTGQLVISCVYDNEWIPVYVYEVPFPDFPMLHNDPPKMDADAFLSLIMDYSSSDTFVYGGTYSGGFSYNKGGQKISFTEEEVSEISLYEWALLENGRYAYCSGTFVCTKKLSSFLVSWKLLVKYNPDLDKWAMEKIVCTSEEIETRLPPMWQGTYNAGKMGADLILREEFDDGTSEWLFSFYPLPGGSGESGAYTVKGTIHPGSGMVSLTPDEWVVQPAGYYTLPVNGTFDPETNHISGMVNQFELDALSEIPEGTVIPGTAPEQAETTLPGYILEGICARYDLTDPADITQEMLDSVTSLRISLAGNTYIGDDPDSEVYVEEDYARLIEVSVNNSPFGLWGPYILPNRYENLYLESLKDEQFFHDLLESFYVYKDRNDPSLTTKGVDEMIEKHPLLKKYNAFYVCDPEIKSREIRKLTEIITQMFRDNNRDLPHSRTLDLSSLSQLKNLTYVEYYIDPAKVNTYESLEEYLTYNGLTFVNSPVEITTVQRDIFDMDQYS